MHPKLTRHLLVTTILAVTCAVAISACGSANKKPAANKAHANVMIAFSECMRAHGLTNFPDPSSGGGLNISGTGINPQSPSFRAAQTTCFKLLPGGGPGGQHASAAQLKQATQTAECMRKHGVTNFPDPTIAKGNGPPDLNPAQYSSVEDQGGMITAIPKSINEQSPAFVAAAKACHFN